MKRKRFSRLIGILILGHLLISIVFMVDPGNLSSNRAVSLYKWYLIPGPFYYDEVIVHSEFVQVSWKKNGRWSSPVNTTSKIFTDFLSSGNPKLMYYTRFENSFLTGFSKSIDSETDSKKQKKLDLLIRYYKDKYVPRGVDSARLIFIRKETRSFTTRVDTVYKVKF